MGVLQHGMLMALWKTGRWQTPCSLLSHNTDVISSVCIIISMSAQATITMGPELRYYYAAVLAC